MINRYQNILTIKSDPVDPRSKSIYVNAIYPDIPLSDNDIYVITVLGDRMDIMSNNIYGDPGYWWVIASANSLSCDSVFPPIGVQLRLPSDIRSIVNNYNQINTVR
jgi:hypothetical protein